MTRKLLVTGDAGLLDALAAGRGATESVRGALRRRTRVSSRHLTDTLF